MNYFKENKKIYSLIISIIIVLGFIYFNRPTSVRSFRKSSNLSPEFWNFLTVIVSIFIFLIFVLIIILIFKKSLEKKIDSSDNLKIEAGMDKFSAEVSNNHKKIEQDKKEEQTEKDIEEKEEKIENVNNPESLDDWRREMFFSAYITKDKKRLDESFNEIKKLTSDVLEIKKNKVKYLELSYRLGNTKAIDELREMIENNEVAFEVNMAIGNCYKLVGDFNNSAAFFSKARRVAINENRKTEVSKKISSVLYKDGKKEAALFMLIESLDIIKNNNLRAELYEEIAEIYDKEKDYSNKALAIEKAIELKPNDPTLLFQGGYAYAESKNDKISLLHYKNASDINPDDYAVRNNLGVQYDNMKMPIKSIKSYKKAAELGHTLAMANLAYRFIQNGFIDEAKSILETAREKEDIHPNVNKALADIPDEIEKEDELEEKENNEAILLRKFFLGFAQAKFSKGNLLYKISGKWKLKEGIYINFEIKDKKIIAVWKEKVWNLSYKAYRIEGDIFNNSSEIEFFESDYLGENENKKLRKVSDGLLCIDAKTGNLYLLKNRENPNEKDIKKLIRVD